MVAVMVTAVTVTVERGWVGTAGVEAVAAGMGLVEVVQSVAAAIRKGLL